MDELFAKIMEASRAAKAIAPVPVQANMSDAAYLKMRSAVDSHGVSTDMVIPTTLFGIPFFVDHGLPDTQVRVTYTNGETITINL